MSGAHAAHGTHDHGPLGQHVGITMAILGVLLALSSALVGGQRTELIATMVAQSNTGTRYQAISTKYRVLLAQLQQLHALSPDAEKFRKWDDESKKLSTAMSSADVARVARLIRVENAKNLNAEIPSQTDLREFVAKIRSLEQEQHAAKEWTESYDLAVAAHSHGAEHYEWAQLAAEIGIVVASIALLFMNRGAWLVSVGLGVATVALIGMTYATVSKQLHAGEVKIEESRHRFEALNSDAKTTAADEELMDAVEHDQPPAIEP